MITYRVTDPDYRTIATIGLGWDAHNMITEAIANDVGCDPEDLTFEEEFDAEGEWTGEELALLDGAIVGRIVHQ
jgi:hypothetical protein